ncbi:MAG: hypothetical protein IIV16_01615 [Alistipes sp.]|nr:hypothetical protein [Alistipes sp.]
MRGFIKHIAVVTMALLATYSASAQYYSWGADPTYMHWRKLKGDKIDVIYPDTAREAGYKMMYYARAVQPTIDFGYRHGPMKIPFVIHPENFSSNGMVMWLPKRVEILSSPAVNSYSMPWLKQLAAHEYRHAVQYNNINRGFVRVFSYILGQQSSTIGLLFMPLWGLEGDATLSETQMSSYGRALQPSFTMHYRAVGNFALTENLNKWFCGSYREYIPDHYQLGYQITAYANTKYDENIWDKIVRFAVRNPYTIATTYVGMRKFYNTSTTKLTRETFANLNDHWNSLPYQPNTSMQISDDASKGYTMYSYPQYIDQNTVLSLYETLDKPNAFVLTDRKSGKRKHIAYTGSVSTRPSEVVGGRVWWTEYRRSLLFAERVNSKLCYMDLDRGRTRTLNRMDKALYPTPISEYELAWVEYLPSGVYNIVRGNPMPRHEEEYLRVEIPSDIEIHGLAYDNYTHALYFTATDDSGMWLGRVGKNREIEHITKGAYITISDLRAKDGVLYFGSIQSGKDEVHCYDLCTDTEYRISASTYGSFAPMPDDKAGILMTTYDRYGYHLAEQKIVRDTLPTVEYSKLPINLVNPPRKKWNTINLDTVRFIGADSMLMQAQSDTNTKRNRQKALRDKRYSGATHLFNIHSWAPVSYDPFALSEEGALDFNLGATIMSQNILSTASGFLTWGWNAKEGHVFKGSFRYYGLGVNLSVNATYGGTQQLYSAYSYLYNPISNRYETVLPGGKEEYVTNPITGKEELVLNEVPERGKYYNVGVMASLPLYFQAGYHTRFVQVSAGYNYSNGLVAKVDKLSVALGKGSVSNIAKIGYKEGVHLLQFGAGYQDMVRLAHKDFLPRWGQVISVNYALNPADHNFSHLISVYGKGYFPGVAKHHSLSLAAVYQTSLGGFDHEKALSNLAFHSGRLIPRGFYTTDIENRNYVATSLNYALPIWYPDGGFGPVIHFKRLRLNLGFDFASFSHKQMHVNQNDQNLFLKTERHRIISYGGDLSIDFNLFRMPAAATTSLTLSVYQPTILTKHNEDTNKRKPFIKVGFGLPF